MVLTVIIPEDQMEEDSENKRGSFSDPDQGVVLDKSPAE